MRFDPFSWQKVQPGEILEGPKGRLQIMCSSPEGVVFVESEGYEVLAGTGQKIDVTLAGPYRFRCDGPGVFQVYNPTKEVYKTEGVVFTNLDRKPLESGAVYEVRKALRELELAKRATLKEIREESRKTGVRMRPEKEPLAETPVDGEPEGEPEAAE